MKRRVWCNRHQRWHSVHSATHCRGALCHKGAACPLAPEPSSPILSAEALIRAKREFEIA